MGVSRGRPKRHEAREKLNTRSVKLSREELDMLESMRRTTGKSRSDILREALRNEYRSYCSEQGFDAFMEYDMDDFGEDYR